MLAVVERIGLCSIFDLTAAISGVAPSALVATALRPERRGYLVSEGDPWTVFVGQVTWQSRSAQASPPPDVVRLASLVDGHVRDFDVRLDRTLEAVVVRIPITAVESDLVGDDDRLEQVRRMLQHPHPMNISRPLSSAYDEGPDGKALRLILRPGRSPPT